MESRIIIGKSSRVVNAKKCTTAINVFHSCTCFFADLQLVLQLCCFFAVVLISCMIPTYNFAVCFIACPTSLNSGVCGEQRRSGPNQRRGK